MSLWAKGLLVLTLMLLVSVFMYEGWYKPMRARAAVTTYYLNALTATSVGVDGTTNMTSMTDMDVPIGSATNSRRGLMNTDPPGATTRVRVYESAGSSTFTNEEFYRSYTPAYAADTRIEADVLAEFEAYMVKTGTSAGVSVQLFDYDPATGAAVQIGATQTKTLSQSNTSLQRFTNGSGTAVNFGNAAFKILAGHRLEVRYLVSATSSQPALLVHSAASSTPSGTSRLIVTESLVADVTVGNGAAEPASITIGPSPNGTTSYPLDAFSLDMSGSVYDAIDTVTVTLAAGSSANVAKVMIASADNTVTYGSLSAPTSGDVWTVPTSGLNAAPDPAEYAVRIIPKSHAQVAAPPGGTYTVTGTVTGITHAQFGNVTLSDSGSATLTIDNSSPADPTWGAVTPGNAQVSLNWTNPGADFSGVVILRNTSPVVDHPIEGLSYVAGNAVGTSQVVYAGAGTSHIDTGAANGTSYYYMVHAFDSFYNYSPGALTGPITPSNPNKTDLGVPSAIGISPTSIRVTMPYTGDPNANNTYTVNYRATGAGSWTNRVTDAAHAASPYIVDITGLSNASTYEVQCIYNDADGINVEPPTNSYTITIISISLPNYATVPGTASATAAGTSTINVDMPYNSDDNANNNYKVEYKLSSSGTWTTWAAAAPHSATPFATAIAGLTPGETYDVRLTYQDADGVSGGQPAVQTFTGIALAAAVDTGLLHNSSRFPGTTKWGGSWGVSGAKYGAFTCATCHQPSAANIKAMRDTVNPPNGTDTFPAGANAQIAFQNVTSMGYDDNSHATSQRVCEACHSQNQFHNYNAGGQAVKTHYNYSDCTACHPHNLGFRATCDICHGNPPTTNNADSSNNTGLVWRSGPALTVTPTGATSPTSAGAHQRHAVTKSMKCVTCHNGNTMPSVSKTIQIGFAINATNVPGFTGSSTFGNFSGHTPLSNGFSFEASSAGTTVSTGAGYANTCSVACHGNWSGANGTIYRPSWVGGSSQAVCGSCHGKDATRAPTRGSHTIHASNAAGNYGMACTKCHPSVTDNTHVQGNVQWALNSTDTRITDSARYNGALSGSTNAVAPSAAYATCTNLYCHSNGLNAASPTYRTPTWGADLNCSSCHGDKTILPMATGSHAKHIASANCADCHNITITSGSAAISDVSTHVNKSVDIKFPASLAVGTATYGGSNAPLAKTSTGSGGFGTCTNVKCHSDGKWVWNGSVVTKTTPTWGAAGTCYSCHGQDSTFNDYREATPQYATGTGAPDKPNAHDYHLDKRVTPSGEAQCKHCHATVTSTNTAINGTDTTQHANGVYNVVAGATYRDGDLTNDTTTVTVQHNYAASPNASTCTNVSCHPVGVGQVRGTSTVSWDNKYKCIDCHNIAMEDTSTFHHAMRNYSTGYPTAAPNGSATDGTNPANRRCTMCHVDHDKFSPILNTNSTGRAYNLRTDIAAAPTASTGFTNTDFVSSGTGGICISCHSSAKTKDTTRRRNDTGVTVTPAIAFTSYSGSAHEYNVPAKFYSDGSQTQGNCSKCHNALAGETSVFMNISTAAGSTGLSFGNHNSGIRRLQGSLGAAGGETAEEQICYRCHSNTGDTSPGGGPPKKVANKDYYAIQAMSAASQGIYAVMKTAGYKTPDPNVSYTDKLYFKPNANESDYDGTVYPSNPQPSGHNTGDTFAGGSWIGRSMSPWEPGVNFETVSLLDLNTINTVYWRMATFVSPAVQTTTTVPAGSWVINIYCRESSNKLNGYVRYMVYKWDAGGMGATIIAKGTNATELSTTAAPGVSRQISVNLGSVTLNAGEKVVVDLSLETRQTDTNNRDAFFYFGNGAPSNLTLPGMVYWSYGDPGTTGYGHNASFYAGVHKPSTTDETQAFLSANKHVECVDCHNPHATKAGLHTANNSAIAKVLRNVPGVTPTWGGAWAGATGYTAIASADAEYKICFRCHSNHNTNVTNWSTTGSPAPSGSAAWTNLALEFNPANKAGHPVVATLNNSAGRSAPKPLGASALKAPWSASPGNNIMTCSDCHGSDSATTKGPHGSSVKWMLTGTNKAWPFTLAGQNGGSTGTTFKLTNYATGNGTSDGLFCLNCHTVYDATHNANTNHFHEKFASKSDHNTTSWKYAACVSCHTRVPHGAKVSRLLRPGTAATLGRYAPNGTGGEVAGQSDQTFSAITKPTTWATINSAWFTDGPGCSKHSGGGTETW